MMNLILKINVEWIYSNRQKSGNNQYGKSLVDDSNSQTFLVDQNEWVVYDHDHSNSA